MHERSCFWKPFRSERVNKPQKLLKSAKIYFYPIFSSFWPKLSYEKSFLDIFEILVLLVNTLTTDYEFSRSNRENLPLPIQRKLSEKKNFFFSFFIGVLKYSLNVKHFEIKISLVAKLFLKL